MKVGIVIPCYNSASTISTTIDSILSQNYPDLDLWVVDGASTDKTMDIVKGYGDRLRWISEPDSGQTEAINKGLRLLDSDIVKWVNSDDVLVPGSVDIVVKAFKEDHTLDFVYGDIEFIDTEGFVVASHREPSFSSFIMLYGHNLFADPASFWRKELIGSIGFLDEKIRYSMDYEMWVKLHRLGCKIKHLPTVIAQYRIESENVSIANQKAMRFEHYKILIAYTPWLAKLPENVAYVLLSGLLITARSYKKIKVFFERGSLDLFSFARQVKKAKS